MYLTPLLRFSRRSVPPSWLLAALVAGLLPPVGCAATATPGSGGSGSGGRGEVGHEVIFGRVEVIGFGGTYLFDELIEEGRHNRLRT